MEVKSIEKNGPPRTLVSGALDIALRRQIVNSQGVPGHQPEMAATVAQRIREQ
jgi:hypothetical protein